MVQMIHALVFATSSDLYDLQNAISGCQPELHLGIIDETDADLLRRKLRPDQHFDIVITTEGLSAHLHGLLEEFGASYDHFFNIREDVEHRREGNVTFCSSSRLRDEVLSLTRGAKSTTMARSS